jgi:release factor glutamine methyltransferase
MADSSPPQTWTIASVLRWAADDFRSRGIELPRLDAEVLLGHAIGATRVELIVDAARPLVPEELAKFRDLVRRRRTREPVAYLLGAREFYGRPFRVDRRVLIPRPDTETLVEVAMSCTAARSLSARVLDLCTGSGCVAISLARERPTTRVLGTDLSPGAVEVARANALALGAYNVGFAVADLYDGVPVPWKAFDLVVANPPYIPSGDIPGLTPDIQRFEPGLALDGGADGLGLLRRVVEGAPRVLDRGGVVAVEVGAGEAQAVAGLMRERGFRDVACTCDYGKIQRVVHGVWGGA